MEDRRALRSTSGDLPPRHEVAQASGPDRRERQRALALALAELGRRERTAAQLRALLASRGIAEAVVSAVIADLAQTGLLDDARYARLFAEDRRRLDGWGAERIARELKRRGVCCDLVALALADGVGGRDAELARALELLRARFPTGLGDLRERRRAFALLIRRGYDSELAGDALAAHAAR